MHEKLRYAYCPGDLLQYLLSFAMVVEFPGDEKNAAQSAFKGCLKVLHECEEETWSMELHNEGCTSLLEYICSFSVTMGHLIESTAVTEIVWDSGEKLSTVMEVALTGRSRSQR